MSAELFTA